MNLLIDIGNTNTNLAISGKQVKTLKPIFTKSKFSMPANTLRKIKSCIICSVVPTKTREVKRFLTSKKIKVYILGKDIKVPIKINYKQRKNLGQDRILCCWGGLHYFKAPLAVIDFGTALTVDFVSRNKVYEGGIILPGLRLSLQNLINSASMLNKTSVDKFYAPKRLIGKTTKEAIFSGIFYGYRGACEYIVARLRERNLSLKVILTGGDSRKIGKNWSFVNKIEPCLNILALVQLAKYHKI